MLLFAFLVFTAMAQDCPPMTIPVFQDIVPTPKATIGIDLGDRQVTAAEMTELVIAIDKASDRVVSGSLGNSVQGRPLTYAIVGKPEHLTETGLATIKSNTALLHDPETSSSDAYLLALKTPAIVWVAGNVHGNEPSGCDAALQLLYHLSDRSDCAATQILENVLLVILPSQNPDGREANGRRNANGFDMNRDWFARTQPETDMKLKFLAEYVPIMFIDAHEMGGTSYFFPPNADPVYHDISSTSVDLINSYGGAMAEEFDRQGISYFNQASYDLFYAGYGDTFPTLAFISGGMTFEKGGSSPYVNKTYEQFLTQWISTSETAINKQSFLETLHGAVVRAKAQGSAGTLQPNIVYNPGHEVEREVPDIRVRSYVILNNDTKKIPEVSLVINRLQQMDVEVHTLTKPLEVQDYIPYGRNATTALLPIGTYIISMAQAQKHLIQALLCEDTYVPFKYFYDMTGWSLPLVENLPGGYSSERLEFGAHIVAPVEIIKKPQIPIKVSIGVLKPSSSNPGESFDWFKFTLGEWGISTTDVLPSEVVTEIGQYDLFVVPGVSSVNSVYNSLGESGRTALAEWVDEGGTYFGWGGGAVLASRIGISTSIFQPSSVECPGAFFRIMIPDSEHYLVDGIGEEAYLFYSSAYIMQSPGAFQVAAFPYDDSEDWYVQGYEIGAGTELGGSTAVAIEQIGTGHSILVSSEINYRAFTGGSAKFLWNALTNAPKNEGKRIKKNDNIREAMNAAHKALQDVVVKPLRIAVRGLVASKAEKQIIAALQSIGFNKNEWTVTKSPMRVAVDVHNPTPHLSWEDAHHPYNELFRHTLHPILKQNGLEDAIVYLPQ